MPQSPPSGLSTRLPLTRGRLTARLAATEAEVEAAQALRNLCFVEQGGGAPRPDGLDRDDLDSRCDHLLIEDHGTTPARLVACCRLMILPSGAQIGESYSARHYDLAALADYSGPMIEIGRFCIRKGEPDPDILRLAWGALTAIVDAQGIEMMFGCSSFQGTAAEGYADSFALLRAEHLAPRRWGPRVKAPQVFRFARALARVVPDRKRAWLRMPPLLRTYLMMGGWVSDHAVVDADLNTLHVFTGLEIRAIPPARARALRAVAG